MSVYTITVTLRPDDWGEAGASVAIATGNVGHLARIADARDWRTMM